MILTVQNKVIDTDKVTEISEVIECHSTSHMRVSELIKDPSKFKDMLLSEANRRESSFGFYVHYGKKHQCFTYFKEWIGNDVMTLEELCNIITFDGISITKERVTALYNANRVLILSDKEYDKLYKDYLEYRDHVLTVRKDIYDAYEDGLPF